MIIKMNETKSTIVLHETSEVESLLMPKEDYEMATITDDSNTNSSKNCLSKSIEQNVSIELSDTSELAQEIQYHVSETNEQTATFVYPQGAMSLISSNHELVSLTEIPCDEPVTGNLTLRNHLNYQRSVVLQNEFDNEEKISVITTVHDNGLHLLHSHNVEESNETSASYLQTSNEDESNKRHENAVLSQQVINVSAADIGNSGNTITLPISFINDSGEVSLLHDLSNLPISLGDDNSADEITMPIIIEPNYIVSNDEETEITPSIIAEQDSSSHMEDQITLDLSVKHSKNIEPVLSKINGHVGRPPKVRKIKRFIGSGSSAISAQGIVKEINNRLVTILPRPEDLRKLIDNKQLVLNSKNNPLTAGKIETTKYFPSSLKTNFDGEYCPKLIKSVTNRGRKKRRGRPRKDDVLVYSTVKKCGRPRKITTLVDGRKGPKFIHTGPSKVKEDFNNKDDICSMLDIVQVKELDEVKIEPDLMEPESNPGKRKLPPRNRGAKYKKMIDALIKSEYDDDDINVSSDDEYSGKDIFSQGAPVSQAINGLKGKRGRPKKKNILGYDDSNGTKIIKLNESLKPIESTCTSSVLIHDDHTSALEEKIQNKLVITFDQMNAGQFVMQPLSIHSSGELENMADPTTTITLVESAQNCIDERTATILVTEDGKSEQSYECDLCGELCESKDYYNRHLQDKHGLRSYDCNQCNKILLSSQTLNEHMAIHKSGSHYQCNHCEKIFITQTSLKLHISDQHSNQNLTSSVNVTVKVEDGRIKCNFCSLYFDSQEMLDNHSGCDFQNKYFVCDLCNLKFMTSSGLNRHRKVHDRATNHNIRQDNFRCPTCYASFTYEKSLRKHIQAVHQGVFILNSNEFKAKEQVIIEQLQEKLNEGYAPKNAELYDVPQGKEATDESVSDPFFCGICNESYKDIDLLCDHYTVSHTGEQSLYCDCCSVGCSSKEQLEKHKLIHKKEEQLVSSVPKNGLTFPCNICSRMFRSESDLEKHHKSHLKQFKCTYCSTSFSIRSALEKHILVHTGKRPFVCDICLKSFRQSAALVRHKLWTHRLKNQNKCELCGKTFFTYTLLLNHLDVHGDAAKEIIKQLEKKQAQNGTTEHTTPLVSQDPLSNVCEYCGKQCASIVALLTHKITHKLHASFKCDQCHRTFREKKYLRKHKLTHKGIKIWKCDICNKSFATKLTLIRHSHVHLREAFKPDPESLSIVTTPAAGLSTLPSELKCVECNILFEHKTHYVRHKLLHSGIPLLKCGICEKLFVHKSDIIRHKVMHSFMFTCNICGRNFHKRTLYLLHKKRHMDDKPFKCEYCGKGFANSGNHKTHLRIHNGDKPFQCDVCEYRCTQSGRLLKHKRMHTGEKVCSCNICGKSFANAESAKVHQRVHTGERPFKCDQCPRSFINNTNLNQHLREHLKEQILKCDKCHHKFRRSSHLEKHMLFHSMQQLYLDNKAMGLDGDANAENPLYMCDVCGRVFEKKKYLYTHLNVHSRQKMFSCSLCGKQLASRLAHKNHMMIHSGEMPHKCGLCEKDFRNLSNLKRHEKSHTTQEMLNCEQCGETFYSSNLLKEHKQNHMNLIMINTQVDHVDNSVNSQLYVFDEAVDGGMSEAMDTTQRLLVNNSQHQFLVDNTHLVFSEENAPTFDIPVVDPSVAETNDRPPPSPTPIQHVSAGLEEKEELEISPDILVEEEVDKPYECDVCLKTFAKKQYLTKHKYRHREVKPHACEICGKRFAQKFEVAVHKIKHSGLRPYCCDICQKEFRSKVNLCNHKMRHTGDYPYLCSVCNKGLSTQIQLEKHVSLHTGAHPFHCQICGKGYFQQLSLIRHINKAHNESAVASFESLGHEAEEQMEVIEAISSIQDLDKRSLADLVDTKKIKIDQMNDDEITIPDIGADLSDGVSFVQPEYLKSCLFDSQHPEMNSKFFHSVFQPDRVEDEDR